jgi:hypothetical protein
MSAISNPASEKALAYWLTLATKLGESVDVLPETVQECSEQIDNFRGRIPATVGQVSLAEKLLGDHLPGKALPPNASTKLAGDLIENFSKRPPTKAMLSRIRSLEMSVQIDNPNVPRTTKALYEREMHAKNLLEGGDLVGQLIDATDARRDEWGLVDAELAPATAEQVDDSQPESPNTSVMTNGRSKGPKA